MKYPGKITSVYVQIRKFRNRLQSKCFCVVLIARRHCHAASLGRMYEPSENAFQLNEELDSAARADGLCTLSDECHIGFILPLQPFQPNPLARLVQKKKKKHYN